MLHNTNLPAELPALHSASTSGQDEIADALYIQDLMFQAKRAVAPQAQWTTVFMPALLITAVLGLAAVLGIMTA